MQRLILSYYIETSFKDLIMFCKYDIQLFKAVKKISNFKKLKNKLKIMNIRL